MQIWCESIVNDILIIQHLHTCCKSVWNNYICIIQLEMCIFLLMINWCFSFPHYKCFWKVTMFISPLFRWNFDKRRGYPHPNPWIPPPASASKSLLSWLKVRSQARSSLADGMSNAAFGANFGMENILLGETPYCFGGFFQSIKIPSE